MKHVRRGEGLERRIAAFPSRTEILREPQELFRSGVVLQMRLEQTPAAFENLGRPRGARPREERGGDAALCGPSWMQELRLGAVHPAFKDARREAAAHPGGARRRLDVEGEQPGGKIRDAERREEARRVKTATMKLSRRDAAGAARDLVPECDGGDQLTAGHLPR